MKQYQIDLDLFPLGLRKLMEIGFPNKPVAYFYFLLNALKVTFEDFREILAKDMEEDFIDDCLKMVKDEILKGEEENVQDQSDCETAR